MSSGETRRTQWAIFFNTNTKDGEEGNSRIPFKRKRDELTPTILVEKTSTPTLVGQEDNEATHCSRELGSFNKTKEQIALKLNRFKDKVVRYKSYKYFLSRCIAEERVSKGLKIELEPKSGNYNQEYVCTWYSKLKTLSLTLMKYIVARCDKNHC